MKLEKRLKEIGLTDNEATVFLTTLRMGQETAFNIAKAAGLKRSTVYFTLNKLIEQGLISTKQTRKVMYYSALAPKKLLTQLENKASRLGEILPELETLYREQPDRPLVETLQGKAGLMQAYNDMIQYLRRTKEVLYFGSIKHYAYEDYEEALALWTDSIRNKRHKVREILDENELRQTKLYGTNYIDIVRENANPHHRIVCLPKGLTFSYNDNFIYGDTLAIFSVKPNNIFAVAIKSKAIVDSYRTMFEAIWQMGREI